MSIFVVAATTLAVAITCSACLLDIASYDPASSFTIKQLAFQYFIIILIRTMGFILHRKLVKILANNKNIQAEVLSKMVKENKDTVFGQDHQFRMITNREDYRKYVPLTSYQYFRPYIDRIAEGEWNVLTSSKVEFLALTSGTTGKHKMFPLTHKHIKDSRTRSLACLYKCRDTIFQMKRSFDFRLFPPKRHSSGGIPMGGATVHVFKPQPTSLLPHCHVRLTQEKPSFLVQAVFALREREIGLINAFSSNVLYSFFKFCTSHWDCLCDYIERGRLPSDADIPDDVLQELNAHLTPSPDRAHELRQALAQGGGVGLGKRIWPDLEFIIAPKTGGFALAAQRIQVYLCLSVCLVKFC